MNRKHSFPVRRHTYDQAVYAGAALGYKLRGEEPPPHVMEHVMKGAGGNPIVGAGGWSNSTTGEKTSLVIAGVGGATALALFLVPKEPMTGLASLVLLGTLAFGAIAEGMGKKEEVPS